MTAVEDRRGYPDGTPVPPPVPPSGNEPDPETRPYDGQYLTPSQLDNLPRGEPLIDGIVNRHNYGLITGRDGTLKTFTVWDWSCCLATGKPWQGRAVTPCKVLFVAGEGAYGLADRKAAWEHAWRRVVPDEMLTIRQSALNLYKPGDDFHDLLRRVATGGYGFVVLDTLRRMSGGADGNSSDMGTVVDNIEKIKRVTSNGSVYVVAHTDKGDNDARGFSGIEDDADVVWHAKRDGTPLVLTNRKMKDGPDGEVIRLRPERVLDSLVLKMDRGDTGPSASTTESDRKILDAMSETFAQTGATTNELLMVTGLPGSTFYEARGRLLKTGALILSGSGVRNRLWIPDTHSGHSGQPATP